MPTVLLAALLPLLAACGGGESHYTGFVEGEERVLRSEVTGRVLEVAFAEGDAVAVDFEDLVERVPAEADGARLRGAAVEVGGGDVGHPARRRLRVEG